MPFNKLHAGYSSDSCLRIQQHFFLSTHYVRVNSVVISKCPPLRFRHWIYEPKNSRTICKQNFALYAGFRYSADFQCAQISNFIRSPYLRCCIWFQTQVEQFAVARNMKRGPKLLFLLKTGKPWMHNLSESQKYLKISITVIV